MEFFIKNISIISTISRNTHLGCVWRDFLYKLFLWYRGEYYHNRVLTTFSFGRKMPAFAVDSSLENRMKTINLQRRQLGGAHSAQRRGCLSRERDPIDTSASQCRAAGSCALRHAHLTSCCLPPMIIKSCFLWWTEHFYDKFSFFFLIFIPIENKLVFLTLFLQAPHHMK